MDFAGKTRLRLYLRKSANTTFIDADLPNIIEKEIDIATNTGKTNQLHLYCTDGNTAIERTYYRHPDGTVDTNGSNIIRPVIKNSEMFQWNSQKDTTGNIAAMLAYATEKLTVTEGDNKIAITVSRDDLIFPFSTMRQLSNATIKTNGQTYTASYTGCRIAGKRVTYYFGNVRTDLTSKIAIERRNRA